jgi:alpha,alpha-trehalase
MRIVMQVRRRIAVSLLGALAFVGPCAAQTQSAASGGERGLAPILNYISAGWGSLTRSMTNCEVVADPKLAEPAVLYLPAHFAEPKAVAEIQHKCRVKVVELPVTITGPGQVRTNLSPPGLLYLENDYVVPGGRFNEMYGWDSYFIVRGLVESGKVALARGMVENFFFEIDHYGTILNANRTYYLTRSQPPFLTSMIFAVYAAEKAAGHEDRAWLSKGYEHARRDYAMWTREPHNAGDTGLARYYDFGDGPAPESQKDESGIQRKAATYFLLHGEGQNYVLDKSGAGGAETAIGPDYSVEVCDMGSSGAHEDCEHGKVSLTADYYKGDRAMRESGFDVSFRFGAYGAATHHYAPVCLNSLLYKTEKDLQQMSELLGRKQDALEWKKRAEKRQERIRKYLWDAQRGMFFDYNFDRAARSTYAYITTFYPLWAGLATREEAQAVVKNLAIFEHDGGVAMSNQEHGTQWDLPYGWAPTQLLAVEGLRRYGFDSEADRISYKFLATVAKNFRRDGTIREKYNVVTGSSESHIEAGYKENVVGFGWTNAAFLVFLRALPREWVGRLENELSTGSPGGEPTSNFRPER